MNREDATRLSEQGLAALSLALEQGQSEAMKEYLATLAKFPSYSLRNCLLIALQMPEATHVAGFHRWKSLGRSVKKGAKGIAILAPLVTRRKDAASGDPAGESPSGAENDAGRALLGFRVVHVFDVSQTEGKELPEFASPQGDPGDALAALERVVRRQGIELVYGPIPGGAMGVSRGGSIVVLPGLSPAQTFAVLAHELAHELMHRGERRESVGKTVRELEAEAVAFVVGTALGLDFGPSSADYIRLYQGDRELLWRSLDVIQKSASSVISELHEELAAGRTAAA